MAPTAEATAPRPLQEEAPQTVIEPSRGWLSINWGDIWQYRELLCKQISWQTATKRYREVFLEAVLGQP